MFERLHDLGEYLHARKEHFYDAATIYLELAKRGTNPVWDDKVPPDTSTIPYVVDYKNRKHIFAYNPGINPIVLKDNAGEFNTTLPVQTWTNISFGSGTKLTATVANQVFKVVCTDDVYPPDYVSTGVAPATSQSPTQAFTQSGQGFVASSGNLATATNPNLLVCAISLFNPATSGKTIVVQSIQVFQNGSETGHEAVNFTTTDPSGTTGFTNVITPVNRLLGSSTTSKASVSSSPTGIATAVVATGTFAFTFPINSNTITEPLDNTTIIILQPGHGLEVLTQVGTAGNDFTGQVFYSEY